MTPGSMDRVERLFTAALEHPADEWATFVHESAEAEDVRREALALLEAHRDAGRFDSIAERLSGLRRSAAELPLEDILDRLRQGLGERYRVERELGRGGTAVVLLAEDRRHGRKVALKVLHTNVALGLGPARFLQEIALAAPLAHPHILPVHDSGQASGLLYYVMPYLEGESLRDRLLRERRLPLTDALHIARHVADALSYAHGHGVIHCDVKPENIMLQAGHAVVTDFGIARALTAAGGDDLSELGIVVGTPAYMSPEQRVAGGDIDQRTDIYSLGCVLYEMLTGSPPSLGAPRRYSLDKAGSDEAGILAAAVPDYVRAAIRRALSDDPADRFATAAEFGAALPAPVAVGTSRAVWRWGGAAVMGGALAAISAVAFSTLTRAPSVRHPAAAMIAILPLSPTTSDTALSRLGRDLVVTLSANLDGVGEIRTVDAQTVLGQTQETGPLGLARGSEIAARLGSSSVLLGSMIPMGADVRIDLGLFTTDSSRVLARVSITADPSDVPSLTDSLTWRILRAIWRSRSPPTPNLAAITTRSVPALRAFLEGEQSSLEGRWEAATRSFARAMHEDPTFWLAHWRYAYARWWYLQAVEDSILGPLHANRFSLPERDRLVLESWWSDSTEVALARSRDAVARFPGYWPAWMERADWLFHAGPLHGHDPGEAWAALERTVALNPNFTPAWEHLYWATIESDTAAAGRALRALTRLGFGAATIAEFGFDIGRVYRAELELARSGTLNAPLLDSIADDLLTVARGRVGGGAILLPMQIELSRRVLSARPGPDLASTHERQLADALAARGAWDSALVVMERHGTRPVGGDALDAYRLAVVGAWLGAVEPEVADRLRAGAAVAVSRRSARAGARAELAWLDGLLAVERQDPGAFVIARAGVRASDAPGAALLGRSLDGLEAGMAGDPGRAARILADLKREGPDVLSTADHDHPYVIPVARLAAARLFHEQGSGSQAQRAVMWFEALWALDGYRRGRRALAALATLEHARILARQGQSDLARNAYARFLARYASPVAAHRPLAQEARVALATASPE